MIYSGKYTTNSTLPHPIYLLSQPPLFMTIWLISALPTCYTIPFYNDLLEITLYMQMQLFASLTLPDNTSYYL